MVTDNEALAAARALGKQASDLAAMMQPLFQMATTVAAQAGRLVKVLEEQPPDPGPDPAFNPAPGGRFLYEVDREYPIAEQTKHWPLQVLQGDQWHLPQQQALAAIPGTTTLRYACPVARREKDQPGESVCLPPGRIPDEWMLRNRYGDVISRRRDGDEFVDVGNPTYQRAVVDYLAGVCQRQGWKLVWLDEINPRTTYSYNDNRASNPALDVPTKYPTQYAYATAVRGFVNAVTSGLRQAGVGVWVNLAAQHDKTGVWDAWSKGLAVETDGHTFEFFVTGATGDAAASLENGRWKPLLDWVVWQGTTRAKAFYNAQTDSEALVRYALGTFLLGVQPGQAWFGAGVDPYPVDGTVLTSDMTAAQELGRPQGAYTITDGLWTRRFEHGEVVVNPSQRAVGGLLGTSARIELSG